MNGETSLVIAVAMLALALLFGLWEESVYPNLIGHLPSNFGTLRFPTITVIFIEKRLYGFNRLTNQQQPPRPEPNGHLILNLLATSATVTTFIDLSSVVEARILTEVFAKLAHAIRLTCLSKSSSEMYRHCPHRVTPSGARNINSPLPFNLSAPS